MSTNARFKIEGDIPEGLPPALCAKGYFSEAGRVQLGGERARGQLLPRPRASHRRAHAQQRVGRHRPGHQPRRRDHRGRGRSGRDVLQRARLLHASSASPTSSVSSPSSTPTRGSSRRSSPPTLRSPRRLELHPERPRVKEISANFDGPNGVDVPDGTRDAQGLVDAYRTCRRARPAPGWTDRARRRARGQHVRRRRRTRLPGRLAGDPVRAVGDRRRVPHRVGARARRAGGERARPAAALPRRARRAPGVDDGAVVGRRRGTSTGWASCTGSSSGASPSTCGPRSSPSCCAASAPPPTSTAPTSCWRSWSS